MKQIPLEIKTKIFALYWNQEIVGMGKYGSLNHLLKVSGVVMSNYLHSLLVTPLKAITDEDAIEVAKKISTEIRSGIRVNFLYKVIRQDDEIYVNVLADYRKIVKRPNPETEPFCMVRIRDLHVMRSGGVGAVSVLNSIDYLRSKGYALPAFGYSVDELVEAGVFNLKEVNND